MKRLKELSVNVKEAEKVTSRKLEGKIIIGEIKMKLVLNTLMNTKTQDRGFR